MSVKTTPKSLLLLLFSLLLSMPIFGQFHFEGLSFEGQGQALMQSLSSVDISPDGQHIYVTSYGQNAVNVFSRNSTTGRLTFVQAPTNGESKVEGLSGAYSTLVSPDGRHVYVAGSTDNAVSVFSRDKTSGQLTIKQTYRQGVNGINGLEGAYHMDFSPDGNYLYVVGSTNSTLVVFERNVNTGELTYKEMFQDGINSIDNMSLPVCVLVSTDGSSVYVAGFGDNAVAIFSRNVVNGSLTYQGGVSTTEVPEIKGPSVMSMSPDGSQIYISGSSNNSLVVMDRNTNTSLLTNPVAFTDGVGGVDGLNGVLSIITSANGEYVYGLGANEDAIAIFSNNNGTLTYQGKVENGVNSVSGLEYPVYFVASPDNEHIYAASALSDAVVGFDINAIGTHLTYNANITSDPDAVTGLGDAKAVATSPDGKHVYAVGYSDDALVAFSRNAKSGLMQYIEHHKNRVNGVTGLNGATDVKVSGDGKHVYVASLFDNSIVVFSRDISTGALTFQNQYKDNYSQGGNTIDGLAGANAIALSNDGKHVYVTSFYESAVAVFSRDENTNELTYLQSLKDGTNGIDGLTRARGICISGDGNHVYAAGSIDNAISIFSRNTVTGLLTYVNRVKNGLSGVSGLAGVYDVVVSPDGNFVFAAGPNDDAIVTFSRNSTSGMLSFSGKIINGIDGVGGLDRVKQLAINPSGDRLYSSSDIEDAISVFNINSSSGLLIFETMAINNQNTVSGLNGAFGMAISPDGMFIYGTGDESNAVTVFSCTTLQNQEETICEGSSITVGNKIHTETGVYVDTIISGNCRTVITTDLTVPQKNYNLSAEICSGGIYNFGGTLYNTSGIYEKTFTSLVTGCDSLVTLNLTVVNSYSIANIDKQICEGETFVVGSNTYNSSGTYETTLTTQHGCDSTIVVNLEVLSTDPTVINEFICPGEFYTYGDRNYIYEDTYTVASVTPNECNNDVILNLIIVDGTEIINANICQGEVYELEGTVYQNTGNYTQTITTADGCVMTLTLDLTVNQPNNVTLNESICEGDNYELNGIEYTESGIYSATLNNVNGCDSIVTVNLEVIPTRYEYDEMICAGQSIMIGNSTFNSTGIHEVTLQSSSGCGDSTVVVNLEVQEEITTTMHQEICEGESVVINNQTVQVSGTYMDTLSASIGCDSIIILELVVLPTSVTDMTVTICAKENYNFNGLIINTSGNYSSSFTSNNGCDSIINLQLIVLNEITANEFIIDDTGSGTGIISISQVSGGMSPYTYTWSTGGTGNRITGLAAGIYTLSILDANGCKSIFEYEVESQNSTSTNNFKDLNLEVQILTNPVLTNNVIRLVTTSDQSEELDLQLFSINGQVLKTEHLQISNGKEVHELIAPEAAGLYFIHLKDQRGRGKTLKISVQ